MVYKQRAVLSTVALDSVLRGEAPSSELEEFVKRRQAFHAAPKLLLNCQRDALRQKSASGEIAITVDRDIQYQPSCRHDLIDDPRRWRAVVLPCPAEPAQAIVEVKYMHRPPTWMTTLMLRLRAVPRWILQIPGRNAATHPASGILISDFVNQTVVLPVLSLLLSFGLSLAIAIVYKYLSRGVPQVRTFPQTLAVCGIVSAIIVLSVGNNIARGIGLVGALTVIRFRNNLQDPRDLIFAFAALATGVAAGAHAFVEALFGTMLFLVAAVLVSRPWFTRTQTFNAILSFQMAGASTDPMRSRES